jgi:hypothetical protein
LTPLIPVRKSARFSRSRDIEESTTAIQNNCSVNQIDVDISVNMKNDKIGRDLAVEENLIAFASEIEQTEEKPKSEPVSSVNVDEINPEKNTEHDEKIVIENRSDEIELAKQLKSGFEAFDQYLDNALIKQKSTSEVKQEAELKEEQLNGHSNIAAAENIDLPGLPIPATSTVKTSIAVKQEHNETYLKELTYWNCICLTLEDWNILFEKYKKSKKRQDLEIAKLIEVNYLPEMPGLFAKAVSKLF